MTEYYIRIVEEWELSGITGDPVARTRWEVSTAHAKVGEGVIGFGGSVGEKEARKDAERVATLDAKREAAQNNVITYDFTPEI